MHKLLHAINTGVEITQLSQPRAPSPTPPMLHTAINQPSLSLASLATEIFLEHVMSCHVYCPSLYTSQESYVIMVLLNEHPTIHSLYLSLVGLHVC